LLYILNFYRLAVKTIKINRYFNIKKQKKLKKLNLKRRLKVLNRLQDR